MNAILAADFANLAIQKRFFVVRTLVAAVPLISVVLMLRLMHTGTEIGAVGFRTTFWTLWLMTLLVAPGMTATAIVDESRNNKLDVLFSGPITATQLVLGRYFSRLALVLLMVTAAFPICASLLVFGGVARHSVGMGALVLVVVALWSGSIGMFVSSLVRESGTSVRGSYLAIIAGCLLLELGPLAWAQITGDPLPRAAVGVGVSPVGLVNRVVAGWLPDATFWRHVGYHLAMVVGFLGLTIARVAWARGRAGSSARRARASWTSPRGIALRARSSRLLQRAPLLWLETSRGLRSRSRRARNWILGLLAFEGLWWFLYLTGSAKRSVLGEAPAITSWLLACLLVAVQGAVSWHRDDEANTLDVLHATPVTDRTIVFAKLAGSLAAGLPFWLLSVPHAWFACHNRGVDTVLEFVGVTGVLLFALALFAVALGLQCRTSGRATSAVIGVMVGHVCLSPLLHGCLGELVLRIHPVWVVSKLFVVSSRRAEDSVWWGFLLYVLLAALLALMLPSLYGERRERTPLTAARGDS